MGLFNFNRNQTVSELTPVNKRVTEYLTLVQALFQGIVDMFETAEASYTGGVGYFVYLASATYNEGDYAKDSASGYVYKSLKGFC